LRSENPRAKSPGCTFFLKKVDDLFLVVALKTQAANAVFTIKIKQIKRSDMVTFLFSVPAITEAKQNAGLGRAEPGRWIFQPGHLTWRALV